MVRAARHLTREELNQLRLWQTNGGTIGPQQLWKLHVKHRKGRRMKPLCLRGSRLSSKRKKRRVCIANALCMQLDIPNSLEGGQFCDVPGSPGYCQVKKTSGDFENRCSLRFAVKVSKASVVLAGNK